MDSAERRRLAVSTPCTAHARLRLKLDSRSCDELGDASGPVVHPLQPILHVAARHLQERLQDRLQLIATPLKSCFQDTATLLKTATRQQLDSNSTQDRQASAVTTSLMPSCHTEPEQDRFRRGSFSRSFQWLSSV